MVIRRVREGMLDTAQERLARMRAAARGEVPQAKSKSAPPLDPVVSKGNPGATLAHVFCPYCGKGHSVRVQVEAFAEEDVPF
jgi:hypothetical protein